MKNRIRINAFNLAEIMLALVIIGVISALSVQVVNRSNNDYTKMYSVAFNTLLQAAGNAALNWNPTCQCSKVTMLSNDARTREVCWSKPCWDAFQNNENTVGYTENISRDYPGYLMGNPTMGEFDGFYTDENFCRLLTTNLNTLNQQSECLSFITSYATSGLDYSKGIDFKKAFCSTTFRESDTTSLADDYRNRVAVDSCEEEIEPSFTTANGQKFYISRLLSTNGNDEAFENKQNREFFRLVVVDLNGDSGPNTQLRRGSANGEGKLPDLVLFALRADGTVIPLGRPEFSRNYVNAIVQYPKYKNEYDSAKRLVKNDKANSEPNTLHLSKIHAWGLQEGTSGTALDTRYGQVFSHIEPLSYSILLYSKAASCRNTPATCKSGGNYTDELLVRLVNQFVMDRANYNDTVIPSDSETKVDHKHGCTFRFSKCKVEVLTN